MARDRSPTARAWYDTEFWVETIAAVPPILSAIAATIERFLDPTKPPPIAWVLALTVLWMVIAVVVRGRRASLKDRKAEAEGLLGAIHALHGVLERVVETTGDQASECRMTVHRVVFPHRGNQSPEYLEQMAPYVGGKGGRAGRRTSIRSGITGLAARLGEPHFAERESDDLGAYRKELVANWSFTAQDAQALTGDRFSFAAVPIKGGTPARVVAVVYVDSGKKGLFQTETVRQILIAGCTGVGAYIDDRET